MAAMTASEMRDKAERYRKMSTNGDDPQLKVSLLLVADEFEQEAIRLEVREAVRPQATDTVQPRSQAASATRPPGPGDP